VITIPASGAPLSLPGLLDLHARPGRLASLGNESAVTRSFPSRDRPSFGEAPRCAPSAVAAVSVSASSSQLIRVGPLVLPGGVRKRLGYATCGRGFLSTRGFPSGRAAGTSAPLPRMVRSWGTHREPFPRRGAGRFARWAMGSSRGGVRRGAARGVNPGSTYGSAKCWPADRFARFPGCSSSGEGRRSGRGKERSLADLVWRGIEGGVDTGGAGRP
jgi:hypothetical protein